MPALDALRRRDELETGVEQIAPGERQRLGFAARERDAQRREREGLREDGDLTGTMQSDAAGTAGRTDQLLERDLRRLLEVDVERVGVGGGGRRRRRGDALVFGEKVELEHVDGGARAPMAGGE